MTIGNIVAPIAIANSVTVGMVAITVCSHFRSGTGLTGMTGSFDASQMYNLAEGQRSPQDCKYCAEINSFADFGWS